MVFSFDSILAFWMRDWLDYKYTYIDDGRSIRLYYPTRSKHSKAKWWIGFFYYVFRCQQFYVHSIILLFFLSTYIFFSSHFWIIVFALLLLNTSMCWHYRFAFYNWFFLQSEIRQEYTTLAFLFIYDFRCVVNMLECHPNCKTECVSLFIYFFASKIQCRYLVECFLLGFSYLEVWFRLKPLRWIPYAYCVSLREIFCIFSLVYRS